METEVVVRWRSGITRWQTPCAAHKRCEPLDATHAQDSSLCTDLVGNIALGQTSSSRLAAENFQHASCFDGAAARLRSNGARPNVYARRVRSRGSSLVWSAIFALALILNPAAGSAVSLTKTAASAAASTSSRLCAPGDGARAYVTTLAEEEAGGQALGARVLAQSLRSVGAKGDIVVLVPLDRATGENVNALQRDGLTVHIVPRGLQTAGGETASEDLMTKIFLWSLTTYDRVVYLDPRSLIQKNPDALFACEGFCAAGAVHLSGSDPDAAAAGAVAPATAVAHQTASTAGGQDDDDEGAAALAAAAAAEAAMKLARPSWKPSTSVMVLEPSVTVHNAMLAKLTRTTSSSIAEPSLLEAQSFISAFLGAGDQCTHFEDIDATAGGGGPQGQRQRNGEKTGGGVGLEGFTRLNYGANGAEVFSDKFGFEGGGGEGVGGALDDAFQPVVLLNSAKMPVCTVGRQRTPEGVCHRLPYTYAAPSTDFDERGNWIGRKACELCDEATEPHIIHFADEDAPWNRLAYLHKPLFWKWNTFREQLENPYGSFFWPWLLFLIPCVVLAFARVYYKTAGLSAQQDVAVGAGDSDLVDDVPSKTQPAGDGLSHNHGHHRQLAILPACGIPGAHDGGAVGVSLKAMERFSFMSGADRCRRGGAAAAGVGAGATCSEPCPPALPLSVCVVLSALVAVFGVAWFRAARALARQVVDASWHPLISIAVYNAWLCCSLVLGLYVMDYVYYLYRTSGRTILRDVAAVAVFCASVSFLYSRKGSAWAVAIGSGIIVLGFGHGSRPDAARRLTGRVHFRCITASCVIGAITSLAVCYSGAGTHEVASRRTHAAAALVQMMFTTAVYASVIGGPRLRTHINDAGLSMDRSCVSTASRADASMGARGTCEHTLIGGTTTGLGAESSRGCSERGSESNPPRTVGAKVVVWIQGFVWWRRAVVVCVSLLVLWPLSSGVRSTTPGYKLEKYGQSCLGGESGFVEAGGKRLSKVCGAEQALRPVKTGAYFEAFRQDKVCLEVAGGGFLTLGRVHVAQGCTPDNQFVFQQVQSGKSKAKPGSREALSSAPIAGSPDDGEYCVYNPTSGFYLSAESRPRAQCGRKEHWRVQAAPRAPGVSGGAHSSEAVGRSTVSMLLHPDFLSRGPLYTLYGYLAAATALLVARAVFDKLASSRGVSAASRGGAAGVDAAGKHRNGGLARRRSGRHSRSKSRNSIDASCLGDPGYAGDAEAGGGGLSGADYRSLSESPIGPQKHFAWGLDVAVDSRKPSAGLGREERGTERLRRGTSDGGSMANSGRTTGGGTGGSGDGSWDGFLGKLFSGLRLACDATLLAGLWCLVPTHFAQALSALTRDHHSAIGQGLGMDSRGTGGDGGDAWSRSLEAGVIVLDPSLVGGGDVGEEELTALSCESNAWWIMSALLRWHLFFLVAAFCHLHGAVSAATSASHKRRDRRTGKRLSDRVSFLGLQSGEALAMRLRTGLGVLVMLCVAATATGAGLGDSSALLLGLHAHPAWEKCAPAAGLDGSWGIVSPLLVFALLAASAGVYVRAGATARVRAGAVLALVVSGAVIALAIGRAYLVLAVIATGMDWVAWGIAGLLSCVCYQKRLSPKFQRESSGSAASVEDCVDNKRSGVAGGGGVSAARLRSSDTRRGGGIGRVGSRTEGKWGSRDSLGALERTGSSRSKRIGLVV